MAGVRGDGLGSNGSNGGVQFGAAAVAAPAAGPPWGAGRMGLLRPAVLAYSNDIFILTSVRAVWYAPGVSDAIG